MLICADRCCDVLIGDNKRTLAPTDFIPFQMISHSVIMPPFMIFCSLHCLLRSLLLAMLVMFAVYPDQQCLSCLLIVLVENACHACCLSRSVMLVMFAVYPGQHCLQCLLIIQVGNACPVLLFI